MSTASPQPLLSPNRSKTVRVIATCCLPGPPARGASGPRYTGALRPRGRRGQPWSSSGFSGPLAPLGPLGASVHPAGLGVILTSWCLLGWIMTSWGANALRRSQRPLTKKQFVNTYQRLSNKNYQEPLNILKDTQRLQRTLTVLKHISKRINTNILCGRLSKTLDNP